MRNLLARLAVLTILFSGAAFTLHAQDTAAITGVVTDATGAVVPGTTVLLVNPHTGTSYKQVTDKSGAYRFTNVAPAEGYTESFVYTGFTPVKVSNLNLEIGITRTQNAKLLAGANVEVEVSAGNQQVTLNTTDATIGNNIDVQQLNELPVYDRTQGIATLFLLQPGVDPDGGAVTGARIDQSEVTVDGMDVNDIASGSTFAIVASAPVDSVDQFTGTVAGLQPSLGTGSGGEFQLVTKSGTNRFHGNINDYNRITKYEANSYFNNDAGTPRTPLIRNQFGGNVGGPIKKDKLFFFFDFADSRIIQSASQTAIVPLNNFRNGMLNYINDGIDPATGMTCSDNSRLNTNPACISTLSGAQVTALDPGLMGFNPAVLALINSRYPMANDLTLGDGVNTGGYRFSTAIPDFNTTYVGRIDYNLTSTNKVFGRFTLNRENATESLPVLPNPTGGVDHPFIDRSYGYVVSDVWTIGRNKVNQFYYGDTISKFSFPNAYNPTGANQFSFSGLSGPYTGNDGQKRRVPIPELRDDFNWQLGAHSLTMGGTFKFIKTNSNLVNNFNFVGVGLQGAALQGGLDPSVRPTDIGTGQNATNDYDNLFATALGVIGTISTNYDYDKNGNALAAGSGSPRSYRYYETEAYLGDTWKVSPKLTVSYGLRYQFYTVPYETHGEESVSTPIDFDTYINDRKAQSAAGNTDPMGLPVYQYILGGQANNGPALYQPSYKDFAPRFAVSYSPTSKTVINAGAGIVYDRTVINAINFLQDQISYLFSNTQVNQFGTQSAFGSLDVDPRLGPGTALTYDPTNNPAPAATGTPYTPYYDGTDFYGLAAGETSFVISPHLKDPYSIALNAGVQQEFPGHLIMKLNYSGRLGRRLLADADASQVIDVPDYTKLSNQTMAQAFAGLTTQTRACQANGIPAANCPLTAQPWFEDVLPAYGAQIGLGDNTNLVNAMVGQLAPRGDISDMLYVMAAYSYFYGFTNFLPDNIGIPSQFGTNAYLTNKGFSTYNGLLLTLSKNFSQGLRVDFNYTWSHSIDNTSLSANNNSLFSNSGFICDVTQPRACRGNSDFDINQVISSFFTYDLPFGRGKEFGGTANSFLNQVIGGWSVSGLPSYRTGLPENVQSDAYLASFDNADPAIFFGNKGDLRTKVNNEAGVVYNFAGGPAGANKVLSEFRGPIGIEYGQRNLVRGPGAFFFDAGVAKAFPIVSDKVALKLRADGFNVFNHPNFGGAGLNIVTNNAQFGQITSTTGKVVGNAGLDGARVLQMSARIEF